VRVLQYAVRLPMLVKYVGQLCIALAVLSCVPLLVSIVCKDFTVSGRYAVVIAALLLFGLVCGRLRISMKMQHNEAMAVTALIFLITPLVMAWPTMAAGLDFFDALFETVSAVTTTGLSTVVSLEGQTKTFLFSRAWMQWVGGLGIVVLGMAALIQPGLAAKRLDIAEFSDDIIGGTRAVAQRVLTVYVLLTIGGIGLLMLSGVDWYNALLYCLSAISTGGFSPHDASLAGLQNFPAECAVTLISMAGAVSLLLYYRGYCRGPGDLWRDEQLKALLMICIVVSLVLALSLKLQDGLGWTEAFRHGAVNGLSALSTAGFSSMDIGAMEPGSKFILMLAMALGGSAGSTAGGIKIIRLLILFQLISLMIRRSAAPAHAIDETRLGQRKLDQQTLISTAMFVVIFIGCAALSWLPFLLLGQQPLDSLFEVFSALGTAGLSSGITAQDLQPLLKAVLCADMLLGRLEIIVWLVFFYPGTWIGLRKEK
jgi:trk system potassium uptake protein TrkH